MDGLLKFELEAKVQFPDLFLSTPDRHIQRIESEHNAVRSAAEALEDMMSNGDLK
ncbi:hypothetical protein LTR17_027598 [Elasticomyces elasticus]|nr:hypothetical protein LTR17_027598 [Elasticomyces elasticus]